MLFGVHEDIKPSELVKKYPGVRMTRQFVGGVLKKGTDLRSKVEAACKASWDAGLIPMVSFKTNPAETYQGLWDSRLRELAEYLKSKPETWVVWYHEPENDMSGKLFSSGFMRCRDVLKSTMPKLKVGYSAMAYQWRPNSATTAKPNDWRVVADFYGADTYSGGTFPGEASVSEHPGHVRWFKEIVVPLKAKVWGLSERGWKSARDNEDNLRAKNLMHEVLDLKDTDCTFYIYWNTTGTENDSDLLIGPSTTEMLQSLIRNYSDDEETPVEYKTCTNCSGTGKVRA